MTARALMVQGCSSHAGKSLVTAALCRLYARRGLKVAPFKSQNMSLNAAVCTDGAEIGRAQALQAEAANVVPTADMNPVLLKPTAGMGCQVVLMGKALGYRKAMAYERLKARLWPVIAGALKRLGAAHDLIVVEGAGSPAEINLKSREIVNMRVARHLGCPVLLVVDIDRGGAFAAVVGTLALLSVAERRLVKGWILNKFRGDARLLDSGIRTIERRTGKSCLGVIPFLDSHGLDEEDSAGLEGRSGGGKPGTPVVAVLKLPHIANYTDLQALEREGASVRYVTAPEGLKGVHAIVLPGSKHTLSDLRWLRARGLDRAVQAFAGTGGVVVGICGGFQMLGRSLSDPEGNDGGRPARARGLGLLPVRTVFARTKATHRVQAKPLLRFAPSALIPGYEIHTGESVRLGGAPAFQILRPGGEEVDDGAAHPRGHVWGTYLHGLFDAAPFRRAFLAGLRRRAGLGPVRKTASGPDPLDRWADHVAAHLDMRCIDRLIEDRHASR